MSAPWPAGEAEDQYVLDLGDVTRIPRADDAWWVLAIERETEGDQDTGWWGA